MSNKLPKECSDCPNSKTVHLTQIVGGAVEKLAVCSACELASEADSPEKIDIICEMTVPAVPSEGANAKKSGLACSSCGFTEDAFKGLAGWAAPAATKYCLAI